MRNLKNCKVHENKDAKVCPHCGEHILDSNITKLIFPPFHVTLKISIIFLILIGLMMIF